MDGQEEWEQHESAQMNQDVEGEAQHDDFQGEHNGNGGTSDEQMEQRTNAGRQAGETEQHRKLFIGGLSFKTEEESLKTFFSQFGEVVDCVVMRDSGTKRPRGFGFITYASINQVDEAQKHRPHVIDGKTVETKRAMPKEESDRPDSHVTTKRMWIGGVSETTSETELREHFTQFGGVQSVELVADKGGKPRGFAFVTFDDYDAVDKAILGKPHVVASSARPLEVRKALSRAEMDQVRAGRGAPAGRGAGRHRGGAPHYPSAPYAAPYYGYYPPPAGGKPRGSRSGGPSRGGPYGGASYGPYSGYAPYGAYSADYGGYEYGRAWQGGHGQGGRTGWPPGDDGSSFGAGYSQYDAGGPMRGAAQYSQRSAGPYGGYSGGYGGGYGTGRR